MSQLTFEILAAIVKMAVALGVIMTSVPMLVWLERKGVAWIQVRHGPNRVGPHGLLQSFADGIKLLLKEDITPANVDRWMYFAAPLVTMIPALTVAAVIPFGSKLRIGEYETYLQITDVPVGILYVLAITSLGVYGIVLSGWSSNNKYSLLGGLRSSAQLVSYELPMGLAVVAAIMIASRHDAGLSLRQIVMGQAGGIWNWNFLWWVLPGFLAFSIYTICGIAETNRAPFDLPEAETELVAGYHTEYSSMKFAMFFLAEYANMLNVAAVATTLFLGGWRSPIELPAAIAAPEGSLLAALGSVFWFCFKILLFMLFFIWLRATSPRLRYDQLMNFTWKGLVPVALANIMVIATLLTLFNRGPIATTALRAPGSGLRAKAGGSPHAEGAVVAVHAERGARSPEREQ
jgi:NADH-quinone oxidoreductase subunit H